MIGGNIIPQEILTPECIEIWFKRMFSSCRKCGKLLNSQNSYYRDDTYSHLHTYCKECYIEKQKHYNQHGDVKSPQQPFILINKQIILFDNLEEKRQYLAERCSMAKFNKPPDSYSSRVGCCEDWNQDKKLFCDQCGGLLRYDDHGDLVCTVCFLIMDVIPVVLERNLEYSTKRYNNKHSFTTSIYRQYWEDVDEGATDYYFTKAYSKSSKRG